MTSISFKSLLTGIVSLALLAACSDHKAPSEKTMPFTAAREYSEQDKIAARALSISNNSGFEAADTPYAQALLCSNAISSTGSKLRQTGGLSQDILRGIDQAKANYDRRVRTFASEAGKSTDDIESDLRQTAKNNPDAGANARVTMACIQQLQEAD